MAIIGISGKKQSGKDTVGKIIQILTNSPHFTNKAVLEFLNKPVLQSNWEIKKFAGKLKEITALLTGYTVDDLEKEEVKNSIFCTNYYIARDGKKLSEPMADLSKAMNTLSYYESIDKATVIGLEIIEEQVTIRNILQYIGTEVGRVINPNIWVQSLMNEYSSKQATIINKDCPRQDIYDVTEEDEIIYGTVDNLYPNWIITDVRFPNEAEAVKKRGILIRLECSELRKKTTEEHISETALDNYKDFDYVINNNSSLLYLITRVRNILKLEGILI